MAPALENVAAAARAVDEPRPCRRRPDAHAPEQCDPLSGELLPQRLEPFGRVPLIADRADLPRLPPCVDDRVGVLDGACDGLLEEDGQTTFHRCHGRAAMMQRRRRHPESIDRLPFEELVPVLVDRCPGRRGLLCAGAVEVADGDHFVPELAEQEDVVRGDPARAHDSDAKRLGAHDVTLLVRAGSESACADPERAKIPEGGRPRPRCSCRAGRNPQERMPTAQIPEGVRLRGRAALAAQLGIRRSGCRPRKSLKASACAAALLLPRSSESAGADADRANP